MLPVDIEKVNRIVKEKTAAVVPKLIAEQEKYGIKHSASGFDKIKTAIRNKYGLINKVSFRFKKTGVYREKGAGRGYGGKKGSTWINAKGETKKTNPQSLGKAGTGKRPAAPWFNPVISAYADELAASVADEFVSIAFNNLKIK